MRNSKICQPFSSAGRMDDGRLNIELEVSQSLRLPPVQLNRELPNEVGSGESNNNSNNTILAESTLVFGLAETGDGTPRMLHPEKDLLTSPLGECHQLTANHSIRLVTWKLSGDASKAKGFRMKSSSCYLSAPRTNTNAVYQLAWVNWCDWCHRRDADPMYNGVKEVLSFLAGMFKEGKSYNTTNVHRFVLSSTLILSPSGLKDVGKHPLVAQLMKGIYQGKPPIPKYNATWDPSVVINHFISTAGNTMPLIQLARKIVTLLAFTTLLRF
jgi:hypothetical protein